MVGDDDADRDGVTRRDYRRNEVSLETGRWKGGPVIDLEGLRTLGLGGDGELDGGPSGLALEDVGVRGEPEAGLDAPERVDDSRGRDRGAPGCRGIEEERQSSTWRLRRCASTLFSLASSSRKAVLISVSGSGGGGVFSGSGSGSGMGSVIAVP
jgi:hypothetical protein